MDAPSCASASAHAWPIPCDAPVTSATRPASFIRAPPNRIKENYGETKRNRALTSGSNPRTEDYKRRARVAGRKVSFHDADVPSDAGTHFLFLSRVVLVHLILA